MQSINQIKDAISYLGELNTSQTNISMVTDMQMSKVQQLTQSYSALAKQLGENNEEMNKGAETYLRAGLTGQDATTMLTQNTIASKLSGVGSDEMSNYLISIKNGFHLETEEISKVVDALSTLDNKSSTSFADISEAMQRSSASSNQVGISWQKLASYISVVSDVTHKSAETIGENYRAIFTRMTNVKAGMVDEDQMGINNVEKVLDRQNIKLRESSGEWRNMGNVISDIANKWKSMDSVSQSQVATAMAGQRQAESFLTLMQNWDKEQQYEQDTLDSQGTSWGKYQTYLQSTDAKLNVLKTTLHDVYSSMVNSNFINGAITGFTGFISIIGSLINTFGAIPTLAGTVAVAISLLNSKWALLNVSMSETEGIQFSGMIKNAFSGVSTIITDVIAKYNTLIGVETAENGFVASSTPAKRGLVTMFQALTQGITGATIAEAAMTVGSIALNAALTMGLSFAITAVIGGLAGLANASQQASQKQDELASKVKSEIDEINGLKTSLSTLDELTKKTDLNADEKTKLKDVNDQLSQQYPELISYYDKESQSFQVNIDKLKDMIDNKEKLAMMENANNLKSSKDSADNAQNAIDRDNAQLKSGVGQENGVSFTLGQASRQKIIDDIKAQQNIVDKSNGVINQATKFVNDYIAEQTKEGKTVEQATTELGNFGYSQKQVTDAIALATKATTTNTSATDSNTGAKTDNASATDNQQQTYNQLSQSFDDTTNKINFYNTALKELNKNHYLSASTTKTMLKDYPEMIDFLGTESSTRDRLIELIKKEGATQIQTYAQMRITAYNELSQEEKDKVDADNAKLQTDNAYYQANVLNNADLINHFRDVYGVDLNNYKNLAEAKLGVEKVLLSKLADAWSRYDQAVSESLSKDASLAASLDSGNDRESDRAAQLLSHKLDVVAARNNINNIQGLLNGLSADFSSIGLDFSAIDLGNTGDNNGIGTPADKSAADAAKKLAKDTEQAITQTIKDELAKRKQAIDDYYNALKSKMDEEKAEYDKTYDDDQYNKNLQKEKNKLSDINASIASAQRDTSAEGKARLKDLMTQAQTEQDTINQMILENTKKNNDLQFDAQDKLIEAQQKAAQDALTNQYSDDAITAIVNAAMKNGWFTDLLTGQSRAVSSVPLPSYGIGASRIVGDQQAIIHDGEGILPKAINPFLGGDSYAKFMNMMIPKVSMPQVSSINNTNKGVNITFDKPLITIDTCTEGMLPSIKELTSNLKDMVTKSLVSVMNDQGVYQH